MIGGRRDNQLVETPRGASIRAGDQPTTPGAFELELAGESSKLSVVLDDKQALGLAVMLVRFAYSARHGETE